MLGHACPSISSLFAKRAGVSNFKLETTAWRGRKDKLAKAAPPRLEVFIRERYLVLEWFEKKSDSLRNKWPSCAVGRKQNQFLFRK
jgi:hypothetical protein